MESKRWRVFRAEKSSSGAVKESSEAREGSEGVEELSMSNDPES
jgi:hypothetical protein